MNANGSKFVMGWALAVTAFLVMGVTIPNSFTAGTSISSSQVNANFAALKTAVDALEATAAALPTTKGSIRGYVMFNGGTGAVVNSFMTTGGVPTVLRTGAGRYTITWPGESIFFTDDPTTITCLGSPPLFVRSDSVGGTQLVSTDNAASVATDPTACCVVLYND